MIQFTAQAIRDYSGIDNATAIIWNADQAERYAAFLDKTFEQLEADPKLGSLISGRPGFRCFVAKYSKRRTANGHRIFYQETNRGIVGIRILHTSMDWKSILD